jgi:Activator of Hsp90 ATPase homolog 1-like protein
MSDLSPISFEYKLACSPEQAFETYTGRIGEWWDGRYTANADTFETVTIEPRVGGRVWESHQGGAEYDWGEVTVWEPGRRLVHSFALAQDPANPSEVAVEFAQGGDGTVVTFEHRGWTEANVADRRKFGDWPVLLDRFAALAQT